MALSVLVTHAGIDQYKFAHGQYFGVICFFLLSSFLLTYQMLHQFTEKQNVSDVFKSIAAYFIRRFFRIYVPYVIVLVVYKLLCDRTNVFNEKDPDGRFWKALYLDDTYFTGYISFTWTIPLEVRYYGAIPIVSLIASKSHRNDTLFAVVLILFAVITSLITLYLRVWFRTFLMGSMIAVIYWRFENISLDHYKNIIGFFCVLLFMIGVRLPFISFFENMDPKTRVLFYSIYWSVHLLLILLYHDNPFNSFLKNVSVLKTLGNFSFGIYLFHMLGIKLVRFVNSSFHSDNSIDIMFCFMSLTFIFSYFFHYLIELRSMQISSYICRRFQLIK